MKNRIASLLILLGLEFFVNQLNGEVFLESSWQNPVTNPSVAIWGGGNESSGLTNDSPHSSNGICLAESAIGQITPQTLGYPGAAADLLTVANNAISNASPYRYTSGIFGTVSNPAVALILVYPGGFNPSTGQVYGSGLANTYISSLVDQADYALRATLRVDPANVAAAQKLVLLFEDRSFPSEFCGSEAYTYSAKGRLLGQNAALQQIPALALSSSYFKQSCDAFSQMMGNPFDAALVEGQNPLLSSAVSNQVQQVIDDYARVLADYASASFAYLYLTNLSNFVDPAQNQPLPQALLQQIDSTANEIQLRLLLASPFQGMPVYTFSEVGRAQGYLQQLNRLHDSIAQGRITFIANAASPGNNVIAQFGEYNSWYVPIFSGLLTSDRNNFTTAFNQAQTYVTACAPLEAGELSDINQVLQGQYNYQTDQNNLQGQYYSQIEALCGYFYDDQNNPFPDVLFAALPPGTRESVGETNINNYFLGANGAIYQQWQVYQQAQTSFQLAVQNLTNTYAQMIQKQLTAIAIASNYQAYAGLILTNGQTLAAYEVQKGEVLANQSLQVAQIQAESAITEGETSGFLGGVGAVIDIVSSDPHTGFSSLGNSLAAIANGYEAAAAYLQIGQVQAQADRQLATINSQEQQLNAAESAAAQYLQADNTMIQLSQDLNTLRLEAKSQAIQIDLAAQQIDQERTKLSTMLAQVAYLLRQYSRSLNLLVQNPQLSQDLIIVRDNVIQQAEDTFVLAQQWCFLAAQSFYYADNCPDALSYGFVKSVLSAQNCSQLQTVLNNMQNAYLQVGSSGCQNSLQTRLVHLSLRNDVFQANRTSGQGTNTQYFLYEPVLTNGIPATNAAASDAAWAAFLTQSVITNGSLQRVLNLDFATSLTWQHVNGLQRNPFFTCDDFGAIISPTPFNNGALALYGIQVSFTTKGSFSFANGAGQGFQIRLGQLGTSSLRSLGYGCPSTTFRYFNFGVFPVGITAGANNLNAFPGSASANTFAYRSPANDHWRLSVNEGDDGGNGNNASLLNQLDHIQDIELQFVVLSYIDPCAYLNCTQ